MEIIKELRSALRSAEALIESDTGLSASALLVLLELKRSSSSASVLSANLGLSRGRMTHLLHHLDSLDLIQIKPDPLDGRSQTVSLSAQGKRKTELYEQKVLDLDLALKKKLGAGGYAMLEQHLDDIRSIKSD